MTGEPQVDATNGKWAAAIERRFAETESRLQQVEDSVRADMQRVMEALDGLRAQLLPLIEATRAPLMLPAAAERVVQVSDAPQTGEASASNEEGELTWYHRNRSWLLKQYAGEWIAVSGGSVVAHAPDLATVMREARAAGHSRPFVTLVPEELPESMHL